jgi:hypothetical protein
MTTYFTLEYSNRAGGSFAVEGAVVTWNGASDEGFIVWDIDLSGNFGKMCIAIIDGSVVPDAADDLTQGGVTADVDTANVTLYPGYFRNDVAVAANGDVTWTGPALGATHSFFFDGQTANVVPGEILTFSSGEIAECITVESDTGAAGELSVRFISNLDAGLPVNDATFTGDIVGDGTLDGEIHPRVYNPLQIHRLLSDLNDDETIAGDDDLSMVDPTATDRSTDQIIRLLGAINVTDEVIQHMFGGSIDQGDGNTRDLYSGLGLQVTTPLDSTQPVVIQEDAIITDYWSNAYMPDSVSGRVRIMVKTIEAGVSIDGQRVKGKLLEFGESYFEGFTTLGTAETSLALFSAGDNNNNTVEGTVAGYSPTFVEGFQSLDFSEGSGATPFGYSMDFDTNTSLESYEFTKYQQRRGSAENLFGRNAQLFTGFNRNFSYNNESGNFTEPEILAYGAEIPYTGLASGPFLVGDTIEGGTSLARGRVIAVDPVATTLILADVVGSFDNTEALTTLRGAAETTATSGTVVNNTASGTFFLYALDDQGTTGDVYGQQLTGIIPVTTQTLYGLTSGETLDVNGTVSTRTINNQYIGSYTGTNYQTNFGIAISVADAIAGDIFPNLDGANISPPDNRTGEVTNLVVGDYVTVYPWDGAATDVNGDAEPTFDEMTITVTLAGGESIVTVGAANIPDNTPAAGFLRLQRDSDLNLDLLEYSSFDNGTGIFTLVGTVPNAATSGNELMRALIDVAASGANESYQAQFASGGEQVAVTVRRGGSPNPIKTFKTDAAFGAFSISTIRTPDE